MASALIGCDADDGELMPIAAGAAVVTELPDEPTVTAPSVDRTLASLTLPDGARLRFIDLGDGEVALFEARDAARPSWLARMVEEHDATPLELYLAAAGSDAGVRERLTTHHQALVEQSPRDLAVALEGQAALPDLNVNGFHDANDVCDPLHWGSAWANDLDALSQHHASGFRHLEVDNDHVTFYPGTSYNTATWLGACASDQGPTVGDKCLSNVYDNRIFAVDRLVNGVWTQVHVETLDARVGTDCDDGHHLSAYTFYSNNFGAGARFRGRLGPDWGGVAASYYGESFGYAVAYNKALIDG